MSNPTPGPWTCERQDHDEGDIYFAIHARKDYEFICNVSESEANGHLIAAAPDLLAVLKMIVDEDFTVARRYEARAAIRKAEGK